MPKPRELSRARGGGLPFRKALVVGDLQQPRKHLGKVAAVVGRPDRRLVGHRLDRHEIAPPDLGAIHPEHARRLVGEALQHIAGLRAAGAAIGVGRHRVGEHAGRLHGDGRGAVHAGQQRAVDRARDAGAEGRDIGADVGHGVDAKREEMPLRVHRELGAGLVAAALVIRDEALAAGGDPFHRPPQPPRRPGDDGLLGIVLALVAEAAADVGRDQTDGGLRQPKLLGDGAADVMRHLRRGIERELARAAVGQHRARLDRSADQPVVGEVEPHHVRRAVERLAHRGFVAPREAEADVAGRRLVQLRRALLHRGAAVDDDGQRLVVDRQQIGGVLAPARAFPRSPRRPPRRHGGPCRAPAPSAAARPSACRRMWRWPTAAPSGRPCRRPCRRR